MQIIEKLKTVIEELDKLDNYFDELPSLQSQIDSLISDYRHLIRENDVSNISPDIIQKIHEAELTRKNLNKDLDILRVYNQQKGKLNNLATRQFLLSEVCKKEKEWYYPYKYRILTEKEVLELLDKKKKRGRPKKEEQKNGNN